MNPELNREGQDTFERRLFLIVGVLLVSIVVHTVLMLSLQDCSFAPLPNEAKGNKKWSKELPVMQMQKLARDPLADELDAKPRPTAAPNAEKQEDRVNRLAVVTESAIPPALPETSAAVAAAAPAPQPAAVEPTVFRPRQEILEITQPTVSEDRSALPRLVVPKTERVKRAADITPSYALMADPAKLASEGSGAPVLSGSAAGGRSFDHTLAPAVTPPRAIDAEASTILAALTATPPVSVPTDGTRGAKKKTVSKEPSAAETPPAPPAPPATARVDEKIVAREKEAVRTLRDEPDSAAAPFERNVSLSLGAWIDPDHPKFKYFRVTVASRADRPLPVISKDLVFLIDASGSIGNDRLKSCRKAVGEALRKLNSGDRFNLVAFRDKFSYAFTDVAWKPIDAASLEQADRWLGTLTAHGNTDVFRTLRSVLMMPRDPTRPVVALVITDGDATSGLTRSAEIVSRFSELNGGLLSIYMYGVKREANAYLMDMLTRGSRGGWAVHTGLRWSAAAGLPALAAKFERPVLTDLSVVFTAASRAEVYPKLVTNLCEGEPIEIFGVCPADQKEVVFSMRGLNGADVYENIFRLPFSSAKELNHDVKRQWAQRRIYARISDYTANPSQALLREMHAFAEAFGITVPYEKDLK